MTPAQILVVIGQMVFLMWVGGCIGWAWRGLSVQKEDLAMVKRQHQLEKQHREEHGPMVLVEIKDCSSQDCTSKIQVTRGIMPVFCQACLHDYDRYPQ